MSAWHKGFAQRDAACRNKRRWLSFLFDEAAYIQFSSKMAEAFLLLQQGVGKGEDR
jgi:hypothetical protein